MKIAVACSGGADSLLLTILAAKKFDVIALIVDHKIRKESADEAKKTAKILKKMGIKCKILHDFDSKITTNIQQKARDLRYRLLTNYCKAHRIKVLATAHHSDDNAETVLLRIARGSGVDGLCGIPAISIINGIAIIRPLLKYKKAQIIQMLEARKISWVEDPTNKTTKYKRNKLRATLNLLEDKDIITERLNLVAENMTRVKDYLEIQTNQLMLCSTKFDKKQTVIDLHQFKAAHDEIAFRLLLKVINKLAPDKTRPRFYQIKDLKLAILEKRTKTLSGLQFKVKDDKIVICQLVR